MARPLALRPEPFLAPVAPHKHAANGSAQAQLPLSPAADAPPPVAAPAAEPGGDAAGMLSAGARRAWHTHPRIGGWWPTAVTTFLPVPGLAHAVEHVGPSSLRLSPSLRRFWEWAALRHAQVTSLAELVRAIADPRDGHYFAVPLQEAFLTALLGTSAASTLERLVDSLRRAPAAPPRVANTAGAAAASSTTGARLCDDTRAPAGAEPQQQPPLPRLGHRLSRHQTSAALASHCLRPQSRLRNGLRKLRALPPPLIRRTP